MKLAKKLTKSNEEIDISLSNSGWKKLKEPENLLISVIISIPLMILLGIISYSIILYFNDTIVKKLIDPLISGRLAITINLFHILGLIIILVFHELIHLFLVPNFISSKNTYFGLTWFGGFVYSSDKIKKGRYILITIAPYILISIIFPIIFGAFGLINGYLSILILLNSISSSVDILNFILIIIQVPNGSLLTSNGEKTYFYTE